MLYSKILPLLLLFGIIINCVMVTSQKQEGEVCITDSGKEGKCLLFENCSSTLASVQNGGKPKLCGFHKNGPLVCCDEDASRNLPISMNKCLEYRKHNFPIKAYKDEVSLIVGIGGIDAKPLEFPHMAILGYGDPNDLKWLCGGSLISENFVLTAAHCIYTRYGNITIIKLGLHQISESSKFVQIHRVQNTYIHPEYNPLQNYHDIALIKLAYPAYFNIGVKPACLHTSQQLSGNSFTGTGWGATELNGNNSDILQRVNLIYVSYDKCAGFYKGQKKLPNGLVDDWQICADGGGKRTDTCQGDSGGPIQLPKRPHVRDVVDFLHTIVGITSFGLKCAIVPAIYTRISYYVPWIESIVWPN